MQIIAKDPTIYVLRFDKGENVFDKLEAFCQKNAVTAGYLSGIGATETVVLSYYQLIHKTYADREISEDAEIVSLTGNITTLEGKITIHAHGVFSDKSFSCSGGHVKKLVAGATCEIFLIVLDVTLEREFNEETGLNLFK